MARMSPRELLEQKKADGRLPADFDVEAALTSTRARPLYVQAGKPVPAAPARAPQGPALPRGQKDVVVAHRGKPVDLRVMAARIKSLADEGVAETAVALEALADRLEALTARIALVQAGLTALEAATGAAAGRLQELNALPAPPEGSAVPDMWAPPAEEQAKPYFPTEVPMRRPATNDPETQVA